MKTFKTKNGLELPLLDLKGKDYLLVAHRIQWWRDENPLGRIDTECVEKTDKYVVYKATISIPTPTNKDNIINLPYIKLADAYKREDFAHFQDANEKASTSAIGRALALCGYGTQFALELDEEERIVDTPIKSSVKIKEPIKSKTSDKSNIDQAKLAKNQILDAIDKRKMCGWDLEKVKEAMNKSFGTMDLMKLNEGNINQLIHWIFNKTADEFLGQFNHETNKLQEFDKFI